MAVHRLGTLVPDALRDLYTTHKGVPIAVKMIQWGDSMAVLALIEKKGTTWESIHVIYQFDDPTMATLESIKNVSNGIKDWFVANVIPKINEALLMRFPADSVTPPVSTGDIIELVDQTMLSILRFEPQANGTIIVKLK
jgi:hypothetical protein